MSLDDTNYTTDKSAGVPLNFDAREVKPKKPARKRARKEGQTRRLDLADFARVHVKGGCEPLDPCWQMVRDALRKQLRHIANSRMAADRSTQGFAAGEASPGERFAILSDLGKQTDRTFYFIGMAIVDCIGEGVPLAADAEMFGILDSVHPRLTDDLRCRLAGKCREGMSDAFSSGIRVGVRVRLLPTHTFVSLDEGRKVVRQKMLGFYACDKQAGVIKSSTGTGKTRSVAEMSKDYPGEVWLYAVPNHVIMGVIARDLSAYGAKVIINPATSGHDPSGDCNLEGVTKDVIAALPKACANVNAQGITMAEAFRKSGHAGLTGLVCKNAKEPCPFYGSCPAFRAEMIQASRDGATIVVCTQAYTQLKKKIDLDDGRGPREPDLIIVDEDPTGAFSLGPLVHKDVTEGFDTNTDGIISIDVDTELHAVAPGTASAMRVALQGRQVGVSIPVRPGFLVADEFKVELLHHGGKTTYIQERANVVFAVRHAEGVNGKTPVDDVLNKGRSMMTTTRRYSIMQTIDALVHYQMTIAGRIGRELGIPNSGTLMLMNVADTTAPGGKRAILYHLATRPIHESWFGPHTKILHLSATPWPTKVLDVLLLGAVPELSFELLCDVMVDYGVGGELTVVHNAKAHSSAMKSANAEAFGTGEGSDGVKRLKRSMEARVMESMQTLVGCRNDSAALAEMVERNATLGGLNEDRVVDVATYTGVMAGNRWSGFDACISVGTLTPPADSIMEMVAALTGESPRCFMRDYYWVPYLLPDGTIMRMLSHENPLVDALLHIINQRYVTQLIGRIFRADSDGKRKVVTIFGPYIPEQPNVRYITWDQHDAELSLSKLQASALRVGGIWGDRNWIASRKPFGVLYDTEDAAVEDMKRYQRDFGKDFMAEWTRVAVTCSGFDGSADDDHDEPGSGRKRALLWYDPKRIADIARYVTNLEQMYCEAQGIGFAAPVVEAYKNREEERAAKRAKQLAKKLEAAAV